MWRRFLDILNFNTPSCVGLRKSRRSTQVVKDIAPILVLRNHLVGVFNGLDDLEFTLVRPIRVCHGDVFAFAPDNGDLVQTTRFQFSIGNIATSFRNRTVKAVGNLLTGSSTIGFHHKIALDLGGFGLVFIHAYVVEGKFLISHVNVVGIIQLLGDSEITQIGSVDIVHGEGLNLVSRNSHRLRSDVRRTSCVLHVCGCSAFGNATHISSWNLRGRHFASTINSQRELLRLRFVGTLGLRC